MKKTFIILILLLLALSGCKAQPAYIDGFAVVYTDQSFYLIDLEGNTFSLAQYDDVVGEMGDYLVVRKGSKFGYIKHTGEEIVFPIYDMAMPFSEGLAVVQKNQQFQVINTLGEVLFDLPHGVESYSIYTDGLLVSSLNHQFGYIDTNGDIAIDFEYDDAASFSEGKAAVGLFNEGVLKYAYIELPNEPLTDFIYLSAGNFTNGYARVAVSKNSNDNYLYGFINEFGDLVVPFTYEYALDFQDGLSVVANYITKVGGRYSYTFKDYRYIDETGAVIINPNNTFVGIFYGNFMPGTFENGVSRYFFNSWGVYDKDLEQIVRPKYMEMTDFKNGYAVVRTYPNNYGIINQSGDVIVPLEYRKIVY